jgi:hypothetical protein
MTRSRAVLALLAALVAGAFYLAVPPRAITLQDDTPLNAAIVRGAFHVHTTRSDGTGSVEEVAAAAGRAGLSFVVLTDHGDATRLPDAPRFYNGVLVIDGVEISTNGGHVVALGLSGAPFPLGGEPQDVVEDIARLGGVSIAAHPGSPKSELQWRGWKAPVDALEWINGDSEWRDEGVGAIARSLMAYPFRRVETLAALMDRPTEVLRQWDALLAQRPVVALAAGDAHARLGFGNDHNDKRPALHVPGYEQVFRAFSIAIPRLAMSGDAASDAAAIVTAIAEGNVYSGLDGLARPAAFSFIGASSGIRVGLGGRLPVGQPVEFTVASNAPADARIVLLKDGAVVAEAAGATLQHLAPPGPGVYRVEVMLQGAPGDPPAPWILSNPIYVRPPVAAVAPTPAKAGQTSIRYDNGPAEGWGVEKSARALGALDVLKAVGGTELSLRYGLGGTLSEGPFVALTMPAGDLSSYDRITFTARAARPMRVSVQLRTPRGSQGERWQRSVYLDETPRQRTVFFAEMTPQGPTTTAGPDLAGVRDVLFVVDTVNTAPGANGQLWIDQVSYGR